MEQISKLEIMRIVSEAEYFEKEAAFKKAREEYEKIKIEYDEKWEKYITLWDEYIRWSNFACEFTDMFESEADEDEEADDA